MLNTDVVNVIVMHHMNPCVILPRVLLAVLLGYIGSSVMICLSDTPRHSTMYCLFGQEHIREGEPIEEIWGKQVFEIFWKSFSMGIP